MVCIDVISFPFSSLIFICSIGQLQKCSIPPSWSEFFEFYTTFCLLILFLCLPILSLGLPIFPSPWGFHCKASFSMVPSGFLKVCPIHFNWCNAHLHWLHLNFTQLRYFKICIIIFIKVTMIWRYNNVTCFQEFSKL